jgi:nucleotide-binding universal stress UspA family protein
MFEKVLILTDFSEHARRIMECLSGIPGIREIVLLHVIKNIRTPMGRQIIEAFVTHAAEKSLKADKIYLETLCPHIKVTPVLTTSSDSAGTILEIAEKNGADLIIISSYGLSLPVGMVTGNVSTEVLCRISRINVLVMRHKIIKTLFGKTYTKFCPMIFSRILCPTDFSPYSERAIALVGSLKGVGEIILLHVVPQNDTERDNKETARTAEIRMGAIRDTLAAQGIQSRAIVTTGQPAGRITETAEEEDVSVIWISSYGKGCFHDLFAGSTAHDVVMKTKRPVIIIRAVDEGGHQT